MQDQASRNASTNDVPIHTEEPLVTDGCGRGESEISSDVAQEAAHVPVDNPARESSVASPKGLSEF